MNANNTSVGLLFVYGSLRRDSGHAMSRFLAEQADYLGTASCRGRLVSLGDYPGLLAGDQRVVGDLYRLRYPDEVWPHLDIYEEVEGRLEDDYERHLTTIEQADGQFTRAWVYWCRRADGIEAEVTSGDWLAYVSSKSE